MSNLPKLLGRVVGAAIALVLVGCNPFVFPGRATETPTPTAGVGTPVGIDHVRDGDSVAITIDGQPATMRLLGVDAPEFGQCGGQQATDRLKELLAGHDQASLVTDPYADAQDRFGRYLGYLEVAGVDVGSVLITEGLAAAWWPHSEPTPERGPGYRDLMAAAQQASLGSWAVCETIGRS